MQLANRLYCLVQKNENWRGIQVLAASLLADAVLMNLRMQALEIMQMLDAEQCRNLLNSVHELPLSALGFEDDARLVTKGDIAKILVNLLNKKKEDNIKYITHKGWLVIIGKLLEVDERYSALWDMSDEDREKVIFTIKKLAEKLSIDRKK